MPYLQDYSCDIKNESEENYDTTNIWDDDDDDDEK